MKFRVKKSVVVEIFFWYGENGDFFRKSKGIVKSVVDNESITNVHDGEKYKAILADKSNEGKIITLQMNSDGIQTSKSLRAECWPILRLLHWLKEA